MSPPNKQVVYRKPARSGAPRSGARNLARGTLFAYPWKNMINIRRADGVRGSWTRVQGYNP